MVVGSDVVQQRRRRLFFLDVTRDVARMDDYVIIWLRVINGYTSLGNQLVHLRQPKNPVAVSSSLQPSHSSRAFIMTLIGFFSMLIKISFGLTVTLTGVFLGAIYFGQNKLIYPSAYPEGSRTKVDLPTDFDMPFEDVELTAPDGTKLKAYLMLANANGKTSSEYYKSRPTIVYFCANAGNTGHRLPIAKVFVNNLRYNCLMLSYRGYGLSEGSANEKGIKTDAQTALDFVTNHDGLKETPIIFYGQSLGGAVAINLAADNPHVVKALILENTFTSIPALIPTLLPPLSFLTFLIHQTWESSGKRIGELPGEMPILFLSGRKDEIVPKEEMDKLYASSLKRKLAKSSSAKTSVKKPVSVFKPYDAGTHNDTVGQKDYFMHFQKFVEEHTGRSTR